MFILKKNICPLYDFERFSSEIPRKPDTFSKQPTSWQKKDENPIKFL